MAGKDVRSATLVVNTLGFSTWYFYGSATIGWLDTGSRVTTGDVVADDLGPVASGSLPGGFWIYDSNNGDTPAGPMSFDVLSCVQADLAAGRAYSTFVVSASRDTSGSIYAAESGLGPYIVASVPEPGTMSVLGAGLLGLLLRRRRTA